MVSDVRGGGNDGNDEGEEKNTKKNRRQLRQGSRKATVKTFLSSYPFETLRSPLLSSPVPSPQQLFFPYTSLLIQTTRLKNSNEPETHEWPHSIR